MNKRGSFIMGLAVVVIGAMFLATLVTFGFYLFLGGDKKGTSAEPAEVAQTEEASTPFGQDFSSSFSQQEEFVSQGTPQGLAELTLSPRLRFERSDTACYIGVGERYGTFPCKMERRSNGTVEEYRLYPTGALNRNIYNPAGELLEITGLNPNDTVSFHGEGNNTWFFDGPDGTVSQLTVTLGQVPPGTPRPATDVIFYDPDGAVRECNCYKSDCCANPMYSLEGKPNTYCTMYPLDKDICEYKKQDNSLPPLPQEANPSQLPIPSRLPAK